MKKFVTINVGSGDAFYLEREEASILYDGGGSEKRFAKLFQNELNKTHVDIIVCSHNDSDHTNGIIGYLNSNLSCNEVWLPANWTAKLDFLLLNPDVFFDNLINECKNNINLDILEKTISSSMYQDNEVLDLESLINKSLKIDNKYILKRNISILSNSNYKLFIKLFNTANRIRQIVLLAYKRNLKIRWFQYDLSHTASGGENYFKPVNCIELKKLHNKKITNLEYLALTRINKESLVFYSPLVENLVDGILFSADSDYSFSQPVPQSLGKNPIITVPHHGSKSNEIAYGSSQLRSYVNNPKTTLVRSDGKYSKRPGNIYKSLNLIKYCTRCNGYTTWQSIVLIPSNHSWISNNFNCCC